MAHQHSAASAGHRRRGAAVADSNHSTNFDAARRHASAEETARAARRRRWRGDPAARDLLKQRRFNTTAHDCAVGRVGPRSRGGPGDSAGPGSIRDAVAAVLLARGGRAGRPSPQLRACASHGRQSDRCLEVYSKYKQCRTSRKSHGITVLYLLGESAG